MIAGDSKPKLVLLQTAAGAALSYADKTAFQGASWDLTWRDADGVALASQPTWTISDEGGGQHRIKYIVPAGIYWVEVTVPGTNFITPLSWQDEGQSYDDDSIAALLLSSQGAVSTVTLVDGDLGNVVEHDSYASGTQTIPIGLLTRAGLTGYADIASGWTISAGFKHQPSDAVGTGITVAFVSAASGTYAFTWNTFPTGMAISPATQESEDFYIDIEITNVTKKITVGRFKVTIIWDRNPT